VHDSKELGRKVALAAHGQRLLSRAYEILADNDRRLASFASTAPVRIGISSMLLNFLVDHPANDVIADMPVTSDICSKIVKAFEAGDIDVAMVTDVNDHREIIGDDLVADFDVEFAWMRTRAFRFDPQAPIPLATWPADRHFVLKMLASMERPYKVLFDGPDYFAKLTAARSGRCLAVIPRYAIAAPFVAADDLDLPPIAPKKVLLAVRGDPASERFRGVVSVMSSLGLAG
jgi:DNA-binding transcriptional LysR family regulator